METQKHEKRVFSVQTRKPLNTENEGFISQYKENINEGLK